MLRLFGSIRTANPTAVLPWTPLGAFSHSLSRHYASCSGAVECTSAGAAVETDAWIQAPAATCSCNPIDWIQCVSALITRIVDRTNEPDNEQDNQDYRQTERQRTDRVTMM